MIKNHDAPNYVIFSGILLPRSQTPSAWTVILHVEVKWKYT